jgi:hypothetical protein
MEMQSPGVLNLETAMLLGIDINNVFSMLLTPHKPILLVFLAVVVGCLIDLVPEERA